jgi:hypothetical protein
MFPKLDWMFPKLDWMFPKVDRTECSLKTREMLENKTREEERRQVEAEARCGSRSVRDLSIGCKRNLRIVLHLLRGVLATRTYSLFTELLAFKSSLRGVYKLFYICYESPRLRRTLYSPKLAINRSLAQAQKQVGGLNVP